MKRQDIDNLIAVNISSSPNDKITAIEHNQVAREVLNYATGQVVAGGSVYFGDQPGGNNVFGPISLGITIPGLNYTIVGHFTSLIPGGGNQWDLDNDVIFDLSEKTATSFTINNGEWSGILQNLNFDWLAITTNRVLTI